MLITVFIIRTRLYRISQTIINKQGRLEFSAVLCYSDDKKTAITKNYRKLYLYSNLKKCFIDFFFTQFYLLQKSFSSGFIYSIYTFTKILTWVEKNKINIDPFTTLKLCFKQDFFIFFFKKQILFFFSKKSIFPKHLFFQTMFLFLLFFSFFKIRLYFF